MFVKTLLSLLPLLAGVTNAVPVAERLEERQSICVINGIPGVSGGSGGGGGIIYVNQVIRTEIVVFPVLINTFVQQNTVINYIGGVTIVINNAPTQIITIATGTTTATNTAITTVAPAPNGNVINIFQATTIINFPVIISTFVQQNTIIQGGGGVNIVINNAPTFIFTTATGTSTVTSTVTATVTQNTVPTSFLIQPAPAAAGTRKIRRQLRQQFLDARGNIVDGCTDAATYKIDTGRLSTGDKFVSTNTGAVSGPLEAAQAIGAISTTFEASGELAWKNAAFGGGAARFCSSGTKVFGLYAANATIAGCARVSLLLIPAAACQGGVIVSSSSSSSRSATGSATTLTSASTTLTTGSNPSSTTGSAATSSTATGGSTSTAPAGSSSTAPAGSSSTATGSAAATTSGGGSTTTGAASITAATTNLQSSTTVASSTSSV